MKIIRSKFFIKLIASLCIVMSLLSVAPNNRVFAIGKTKNDEEVYGSTLLTPITKLLTALGDGIMDIIHSTILEQEETLIRLDANADSWWEEHGIKILGWIVGIVLFVIIMVSTAGAASPLFAGVGIATKLSGVAFVAKTFISAATIGAAAGTGVTVVARVIDSTYFSNDIYLPVFKLTPEEIFADKVWLFDVNFFEPETDKNYTLEKNADSIIVYSNSYSLTEQDDVKYEDLIASANSNKNKELTISEAKEMSGFSTLIDEINKKLKEAKLKEIQNGSHSIKVISVENETIPYTDRYIDRVQIFIIDKNLENEYLTIMYNRTKTNGSYGVSPQVVSEEIIVQPTQKVVESKVSVATELRGVITNWYFILRNLAILLLLLFLVYAGIRIVLGSTAGEKAKYKERIIDWLVSMCLIFVMQYIMIFSVELNERFVELVDSTNGVKGIVKIIKLTTQNHIDVVKKDGRLNDFIRNGSNYGDDSLSGTEFLEWPTNLAGGFRIEQQLTKEGTANWIGYTMCYLVIVAYTIFFAWTYLRRVLYMAFLTMISPLVAMTYSLDKITDGKAQAFNSWLKEYIFNLLIQPFHLILYTVLVTSAFELAGENAIYALVAIGFMMPAEKLLRKFFGFEKAQTPGALGGAAGAALAMTGLQKIIAFGNKDVNPPEEDSNENNDIKFSSADGVSAKSAIEEQLGGLVAEVSNVRTRDTSTSEETDTGREIDVGDDGSGGTHIRMGAEERRRNTINVLGGGASGENTVDFPGRVIDEPPITTVETNSNNSSITGRNVTVSGGETRRTGETYNVKKEDLNMQEQKNPSVLRRTGRAIGSGISGYFRLQGQKHYKRVQKSRPIRSLARGAAGLAAGTFLGMAGLALGIASGDASKALQYTSAGAIGGWGVGKGVTGRIANTLAVDRNKMKEEWQLSFYGENYKKAKLEEQKKMNARDEDRISYIRKTLGVSRKDAIEILETTGADCIEQGIDNIEDVATIHMFKKEQEILKRIEMENEELERDVQIYVDENWDKDIFELTADEEEQVKKEAEKEYEEEYKKLEEEERKEQEKVKKEHEENLRKLDKKAAEMIRQNEEEINAQFQMKDSEKNDFERQIIERKKEYTKDIDGDIRQIREDLARRPYSAKKEDIEERIKQEERLTALIEERSKKAAEIEKQMRKDKEKEIEKKIKDEKERRATEYKKAEERKLEEKLNEKAKENKAKVDEKRAKLDEEKKKKENEIKQRVRREKARQERVKSDEYKKAREDAIKKIKKSIEENDESFQKASESAFALGVGMKKYSSRTPDFTKLGAKKIESYRKQFSNEFYADFLEEESKKIEKEMSQKGISLEEATKNAQQRAKDRADATATATIEKIKLYDDKKGSLTEARKQK